MLFHKEQEERKWGDNEKVNFSQHERISIYLVTNASVNSPLLSLPPCLSFSYSSSSYLFILLYINPLINASHYNVKKMKINHKLEIEGRNKQSVKTRFGVHFLMARSSCRCTKPTSRPGRKEKEACRTQKKKCFYSIPELLVFHQDSASKTSHPPRTTFGFNQCQWGIFWFRDSETHLFARTIRSIWLVY